jgi:hypothetical protein
VVAEDEVVVQAAMTFCFFLVVLWRHLLLEAQLRQESAEVPVHSSLGIPRSYEDIEDPALDRGPQHDPSVDCASKLEPAW